MKEKIIILTLLFISILACKADTDTDMPSADPDDIKIEEINNRPKSNQSEITNLSCSYFRGNLNFRFATPEGKALVKVTNLNSGTTVSSTFLTFHEYNLYIGEIPGNYEIYVETTVGSKYLGYFLI